ncbi:MAG: ACT domain-containing protein [Methylococcales bacterium]|nr:ACT domain-containing protein [Methylococcales bacterium]
MHLAITALSQSPTHFIADILEAVTHCHCNILELRSTHLEKSAIAAYLLVEGNWNHLAKLESILNSLQKRLNVQIHTQQTKTLNLKKPYITYKLETISINQQNITQDIITFLSTRNILIDEIKASCRPDYTTQTSIFSSYFILLIPVDIQLSVLREEILNFCDDFNLDAIFEPVKYL